MNSESEDSDGEGFYKPAFQVTTPVQAVEPTIQREIEELEEANTFVVEDRPTDFKPRLLSVAGTYQ